MPLLWLNTPVARLAVNRVAFIYSFELPFFSGLGVGLWGGENWIFLEWISGKIVYMIFIMPTSVVILWRLRLKSLTILLFIILRNLSSILDDPLACKGVVIDEDVGCRDQAVVMALFPFPNFCFVHVDWLKCITFRSWNHHISTPDVFKKLKVINKRQYLSWVASCLWRWFESLFLRVHRFIPLLNHVQR